MDPQAQTSFIPKRALAEDRAPRQKTVSIFSFLATILFLASIAGAGAMYFYEHSLTAQVQSMQQELAKAKDAFEESFLQQLEIVDARLHAASDVLQNHITVTPIFTALQQSTLRSVQFTKFVYAVDGTGTSASVLVKMSGKAQSYNALALQNDQLTKNKYIRNPIFSNLTLDPQGNVLFDLSFSVDPKFVLYGDSLSRVSQQAPATNQPQTPQTPQSTTPVTDQQPATVDATPN
jgi:hypothetical protein